MAFCPNCGAQASGAFCPNCGTRLAGNAGASTGASAFGSATGAGSPSAVNASGLSTGAASALCYLLGLITGIVFLVIAPYNQNKTVRFHAFQSIFTHLAIMVIGFVGSILLGIFAVATHGLGMMVFPTFFPIFSLAVFVLWLYLMYSAYNNQMVKLPLVGDLAAKQA